MMSNYYIPIFLSTTLSTTIPQFWIDVLSNGLAGIALTILFFFIRDWIRRNNNISGRWIITEKIIDSNYRPYIGMKLISTLNLLHYQDNISGTGEKVSETTLENGEFNYLSEKRTKYSVQGNFDWRLFGRNIYRLHVTNHGNKRITSALLTVKRINRNRLEGSFISEAAESIGTVTFERKDFVAFGEGIFYRFCIIAAQILNVRLVENIEHHFIKFYARSKKPKNFEFLQALLINIEDKDFYTHSGISVKGFLRAIVSRNRFLRRRFSLLKSGGSTISMQLVRTLFISDYSKTIRRKILELIWAIYIERLLSKKDILKLYLVSVKFGKGIYGISSAMKFYFPGQTTLSNEQCFFLIERLSSITNSYSANRIRFLVRQLNKSNYSVDLDKVMAIYKEIFTT